jgi:enoyl-CoA hydratase/carnithine racemase
MEINLETVKFKLSEDGIGIITLNRPERMNAISAQFTDDFNAVLDALMNNLDCRVVIVKGEGKAFCAGMDLKEASILMKRRVPESYQKFNFIDVPETIKRTIYTQARLGEIVIKLRKINQPVIALINGPAVGGGFTFAMAADVRIATENGRFSIGAINVGMGGGDIGGSYFLPRLIGMSRAAELMYTGRFIGAKEAEEIGLVLKVVSEDKLMDTALEMANEMLSKSPLGLRMTKEAINISMDSPSLDTMVKFDNRGQSVCTSSKDIAQAIQMYVEKKKPEFPLR